MRIALFGATGGTGLAFLLQAVQANHKVTCLVRDPSKVPAELANNTDSVRLVIGHSRDQEKVEETIKDAEATVVILGPSGKSSPENTVVCSESQRFINNAVNKFNPSQRVVV
eukprot:Colp12_sorted_trinity150504_noHs@21254